MSLLTQVRGFTFLFHKSSRPSSIKPFTAHLYRPFKWIQYQRYSKESRSRGVEERAPSTAEQFKRVAEEKVRVAEQGARVAEEKLRAVEQGAASQTEDKLYDGAEEATIGESKLDPIDNRFEQREARADYRKKGDNK